MFVVCVGDVVRNALRRRVCERREHGHGIGATSGTVDNDRILAFLYSLKVVNLDPSSTSSVTPVNKVTIGRMFGLFIGRLPSSSASLYEVAIILEAHVTVSSRSPGTCYLTFVRSRAACCAGSALSAGRISVASALSTAPWTG